MKNDLTPGSLIKFHEDVFLFNVTKNCAVSTIPDENEIYVLLALQLCLKCDQLYILTIFEITSAQIYKVHMMLKGYVEIHQEPFNYVDMRQEPFNLDYIHHDNIEKL